MWTLLFDFDILDLEKQKQNKGKYDGQSGVCVVCMSEMKFEHGR